VSGPLAVLVGAPGAGKTTVGRALAARLGVAFRDTDADVEAAAGKRVADIFLDDGEAEFRRLERAAVAAALAEHDGVLSLGGGAVTDPQTRAALSGHIVVWLEVALHDAAKRVGWGPGRPMLDLNPRARLAELMRERAGLYEQVATVRVETSGRTVDEVVADVLRAVPAVPR
jgi:shikimate kinase